MATSASPPSVGASWNEPDQRVDTQGLQMGMSGLSLGNSLPNRRPSALSGSSLSTGTEEPASRHHSFGSGSAPSFDHNQSGIRGTPPPPGSPRLQKSMYHNNSLPKPPGLGGFSVPSPIGKNSTTNNTLSSSPNLTLTPSSSVDGNEMFSGFSSFMPDSSYLVENAESRKARSPWSDFGGFGIEDPDDGLRGLGALRDRAQSSPGPISSSLLGTSPPVRIDLSSHQGDLSPLYSDMDSRLRGLPPDPRRMRTAKDSTQARHSTRPPLSGGVGLSQSPYNFDFNHGDTNRSITSGSSQGDWSGLPRPELSFATSDSSGGYAGHTRSRSSGGIGLDNTTRTLDQLQGAHIQAYGQSQHQQLLDQSHTHKFGTLPNLNSHIQQQQYRMPPQHNALPPKNRHMRSLSHSGALQRPNMYAQETYDDKSIGRSTEGRLQHSHFQNAEGMYAGENVIGLGSHGFGRSASAGDNLSQAPSMLQRSTSLSQPSLSSQLENLGGPQLQRRNSDMNQGGFVTYGGQQGLQGRHTQYPQAREDYNLSISQPNLPTHLEGAFGGPQLQRRSSDAHHGGFSNYGAQQSMQGRQPKYQQRREDFIHSNRYDDSSAPVMATPDEMRLFNMSVPSHERSGSFGYTPSQSAVHHQNALMGGRQPQDFGGSLSSSPMSAEGGQRNVPHRGQYGNDDDITHPLVGEHINDPGEDHGYGRGGMQAAIMQHSSGHNPYNLGPSSMSLNRHVSAPTDRAPMGMNPYGHADQMNHHTSGGQLPNVVVYNVKFKRTQRTFIVGPRVRGDLKMGCYVKVEADRGEDLGIIVGKVPSDKFNGPGVPNFRSGMASAPGMHGDMGMIGPGGVPDLKRITRLATPEEVGLLNVKREEEEELLKICRTKCRQRALPMTVVDAEYQFDRHKLTFFFEAEGRIDFRELVRDLFSMYKTRIWMQQLDKNIGTAGTMSAPSGSEYGAALGSIAQMVEYPTEPVFAPPSEMGDFAGNTYH